MTGFASKRTAAAAKVSETMYDTFYITERTKLLDIIKRQLLTFDLVYNDDIFNDFSNKALKAEIAWNDRLIFEKTNK